MSSRVRTLVVAGTHSGVGKTSVMVGLIKAFEKRGIRVGAFKCGPDYLDPSYHSLASGRSCHNLDGWMMGRSAVTRTLDRVCCKENLDLAIVEGVMGVFDGAGPTTEAGSTAQIAKWLEAPVLLVVDVGGMARSVKALVDGFINFDKELKVAGVVANRVGSKRHLELVKEALGASRVVGGLPKSPGIAFPERYLGLQEARKSSTDTAQLSGWGDLVDEWFDVDRVYGLAGERNIDPSGHSDLQQSPKKVRLGIAQDEAFSFYYEDNLRYLELLGAELVPFSPLLDKALPDVDGLYFGGGYPEVFAQDLAANDSMRAAIKSFGELGRPVYGECGGMMYLMQAIRTKEGKNYPMVGLLPGEPQMSDRLQALGYVEVEIQSRSLLGRPGTRFRGHQFRYSEVKEVEPDQYRIHRRRDRKTILGGYRYKEVLGSYIHGHWASNEDLPKNFIAAMEAHQAN